MEDVMLYETPWLALCTMSDPEAGVSGYVYSRETRCQGRIVAVLPYRVMPRGHRWPREYLARVEVTPCWGMTPNVSAVTGGYEGGDIRDDAVREVLEETGYAVTREALIDLGESFGTKSTDTVYSLYAVDVTDLDQGEAVGDGSVLESQGGTRWLAPEALAQVRDPQVALMYLRLGARG